MTQTLPTILEKKLQAALVATGAELPDGFCAQVTASADTKFGDYQSNSAMILGKRLKTNPRELAQQVADAFDGAGICQKPEVAGPGFINFRITSETFAGRLAALLDDAQLGVPTADPPHTIVIDFSSPNVAKPMHIGHIRSTIIGDCLARVARFVGHKVIADNHIGDWGTQFGMIIYGWKNQLDEKKLEADPIHELLRIYKVVNQEQRADENVAETCRSELVKLQGGDVENLDIWKRCVELSLRGLAKMYERLDVKFDHYHGESFYNERLAPVVADMAAKGIARVSDGAMCVFFDQPGDDAHLADKPFIIRKADGGFLYSTSDLATIDFRLEEFQADDVWYIVGSPQQLHFQQLFAAARKRGIEASLVHVPFGSILGEDRKLMKTRAGENVQLIDVLDEAEQRALKIVEEKNPALSDEEKSEIAAAIGIGAVKYAELSQNRMTDYVFSWAKMLSFQGNTAPYLQNAYVRTRAIFRKLGDSEISFDATEIEFVEPGEIDLVRKLCQFGEIVPDVLADHRPNLLANYLYELAATFHSFYEACQVLTSEGATRNTRLILCELTSRILKQGLDLLGIRVTERM